MQESTIPVTKNELIEKAKGRRVTEEAIKAQIAYVISYNVSHVAQSAFASWNTSVPADDMASEALLTALSCKTQCQIVLKSGFSVSGESVCADPANYSCEIGERLAYQDAFSKLWALEGYLLKNELSGRIAEIPPGHNFSVSDAGLDDDSRVEEVYEAKELGMPLIGRLYDFPPTDSQFDTHAGEPKEGAPSASLREYPSHLLANAPVSLAEKQAVGCGMRLTPDPQRNANAGRPGYDYSRGVPDEDA